MFTVKIYLFEDYEINEDGNMFPDVGLSGMCTLP
jgi:hypothetical protein